MRVRYLLALGAAGTALLIGPGAAWAQDEGTAGAGAPVQGDPTAAPQSDPATAPEPVAAPEVAAPSDTDTSSATTEGTATDPAGAPEPSVATDAASASGATAEAGVDQPQAEVETTSQTFARYGVRPKAASSSCHLARAAAGVGPPCAGGSRTGRGQISQDPANPTVLPAVNGVTIGIWIVTLPNGNEVVNWQIISGTFNGTDAIDLKVKSAGPSALVFTCQVTNAATSGACPALVNQSSGKGHVDFVDACPGSTTNPPVNPPPGGGGGGSGGVAGQVGSGGQQGVGGKGKGGGNVAGAGAGGGAPSVAGAAIAANTGEASGLPVTGFAVIWLLLIGTGLVGGGTALRVRRD